MSTETGIRNASCFIVLQGYLVSMGIQCRINSPRSCIVDVKWKGKRLPAGVKIGEYVTLVGQLITLDLGRAFIIINAEALKPKSVNRIKKFIEKEKRDEKLPDSGGVRGTGAKACRPQN